MCAQICDNHARAHALCTHTHNEVGVHGCVMVVVLVCGGIAVQNTSRYVCVCVCDGGGGVAGVCV
jgi:hypothetical protein